MFDVLISVKIEELEDFSCMIDEYFSFSVNHIAIKDGRILIYFDKLTSLDVGEYNDKTLCTLVLEEMCKTLNEVYIVCNDGMSITITDNE